MPKSIMRMKKIKSKSTFSQIERHHNERHRLPYRAHAEKESENRTLTSKSHSAEDSLTERFEKLTEGVKIRKNAVLAVEVVLTFSPDFPYSKDWVKENLKWLDETFGKGNTLAVQEHFDEKTPHLHAIVVPLREGKLTAKYWFNGREALSKLQDSYAAAMARFGLERGKNYVQSGEKAPRHQDQKEWWRDQEREKMKALEEKVFGKEEER